MRYINVRYLLTYLLTLCLIRAGERRNRNDVPLFFERLNAVAALVADTAVLFLRAFVKKNVAARCDFRAQYTPKYWDSLQRPQTL